jgi:hypothetical protein
MFCALLPQNPELVPPTHRAIERYWAFSDGDKQAMLLDLILAICAKLPPPVVAPYVTRLFRFLATLLMSATLRVVELALDLWIKSVPGDWIALNAKVAIPEMIDNVTVLSEKHWSNGLIERANLALGAMTRIDKAVVQKYRAQQKQMKAQRYQRKYISNECQKQWNAVAEAAAEGFAADFNLNAKKHEIYDIFHNEKPEVLAPSRFVPVEKPGS